MPQARLASDHGQDMRSERSLDDGIPRGIESKWLSSGRSHRLVWNVKIVEMLAQTLRVRGVRGGKVTAEAGENESRWTHRRHNQL